MTRQLLLLTLLSWLSLPSATAAHESGWEQAGSNQLSSIHVSLATECFSSTEHESDDQEPLVNSVTQPSSYLPSGPSITTILGDSRPFYAANAIRGPPSVA